MAITDDLRKTFTDPTPLYFAAGTADLAVQQARKVPALLEQLAAEAPGRIEAVRNADPKAVQEKVSSQAKEAQATVQAKVNEVFGGFDADFKKFGETAQDLALRGVGVAAEYAVKARETYEKVAEHGEQTVRNWRGEAAEEITEIAVAVEPEPVRRESVKTEPVKTERVRTEPAGTTSANGRPARPAARKPAAERKAAAPKKSTPPAE
ncbi:hypothetical protein GCM10010232_63770 [Streptomyces amakusaensis]|uniref:Heparin binding hemagglutinin HbhA n=1 Tax=Streptomyces amakusaensis TaxID=67271 RepID=A0ABW0AUF7_9ACTN